MTDGLVHGAKGLPVFGKKATGTKQACNAAHDVKPNFLTKGLLPV